MRGRFGLWVTAAGADDDADQKHIWCDDGVDAPNVVSAAGAGG